jgi:enoyl-CoA hydratase/carnithine racemase
MTEASQAEMPHLRLTVHPHVGWLECNRPPVNAFHQQMGQEVVDALHEFEAHRSVRVIVFASALARYFSAGAELRTFVGMGKAGMATWCHLVHHIVYAMRTSRKPILAAIHGVAVGGGLEMTLPSDVRFAANLLRNSISFYHQAYRAAVWSSRHEFIDTGAESTRLYPIDIGSTSNHAVSRPHETLNA